MKSNLKTGIPVILAILFTLIPALLCEPVFAGDGSGESYISCSWDGVKVVNTVAYEEDVPAVPADGSMAEGWYYLNSNVTVDSRIFLTGDTNLILGNGFSLDVKGIYVPQGSTLTVYAQSLGTDAGTIRSHPSEGAAIGAASDNHPGGEVVIHGGNIIAKGAGHCAGIGSNDGNGTTAAITIYNGYITAAGGSDGAGIGGGRKCDGGSITIYGGTITANGGGENGASIGGGDDSDGGSIEINGGTLICNEDPNEDGAGIGGGDGGDGGDITINGGILRIWSRDGACIGGGDDGKGGNITINGGEITCRDEGSAQGARIGGGSDDDGGNITINGGVIHVYSRDGAGIGGGEDGDGGNITITGGSVTTHPQGQGNGAGIGGGNHSGKGGTIIITGGSVTADSKHGAGIGGGRADDRAYIHGTDNSGAGGNITISGGKVHASSLWAYGIGAGGSFRERGTQFSTLSSEIGSAGTITIDGTADVTAEGYLAGIGGDSGKISIKNGTVTASGYDDDDGYGIHLLDFDGKVTISGGTVNAYGVAYCAGISCERGSVTISGGTINAFAGRGAAIGTAMDDGTISAGGNRNSSDEGRFIKPQGELIIEGKDTVVHATSWYNGIGGIECGSRGTWIFRDGAVIEVTITKEINAVDTERGFYEGARITAGSSKENAAPLKAEEREKAYAKYKYRLIEPCSHEGTMENGRCRACGYAIAFPVDLKIDDTGLGKAYLSKSAASYGDEVEIMIAPKGSRSAKVSVKKTEDDSVIIPDLDLTGSSNTFIGKFTMPAYPVTVLVEFMKASDDAEQAGVSGTLMAKLAAVGSRGLTLSWNKIDGAKGYDIFFAGCGEYSGFKKVKTVRAGGSLKWTNKKLKKKTAYKAYVKAWVMKDGRKVYVKKSPEVHAYTTPAKVRYTAAKSLTVKKSSVSIRKGGTYKIKAAVKKQNSRKKLMPASHSAKIRYMSTNSKVATVSSSGKIKAVKKGTCYIYVYAQNGVFKKIKLKVS